MYVVAIKGVTERTFVLIQGHSNRYGFPSKTIWKGWPKKVTALYIKGFISL